MFWYSTSRLWKLSQCAFLVQPHAQARYTGAQQTVEEQGRQQICSCPLCSCGPLSICHAMRSAICTVTYW